MIRQIIVTTQLPTEPLDYAQAVYYLSPKAQTGLRGCEAIYNTLTKMWSIQPEPYHLRVLMDYHNDRSLHILSSDNDEVKMFYYPQTMIAVAGSAAIEQGEGMDPGLYYISKLDEPNYNLRRGDIFTPIMGGDGSVTDYLPVRAGAVILVEGCLAYRMERVQGDDEKRRVGTTPWFYVPYACQLEARLLPDASPTIHTLNSGVEWTHEWFENKNVFSGL